ncbi:FMN-binding negative transcriptional regulator [Budvicia aquatica]|uniref:FMN-binding negative transcriptional regulator n=1 Tax=Budvicia aquatica TaxID=82979 RepID=UPI001B548135|nr:FMN-binding negative transcriptional regulator [Budvicia aquatica]MBP9642434.1 FMN-binding negative transcriptional regulator [Budvicia sp.]GKX53326.1 transcriptional regulator [Budvicia aquatica]
MYLPSAFKQNDLIAQVELIRQYPLGLLISYSAEGIEANPIPFLADVDDTGQLILRAHLSRGNGQWKRLTESSQCMVVFQGAEGYTSPSWYPSKKQSGGKAVPTWNYVCVQVSGEAKIIDDTNWILTLLNQLTTLHENGKPEPWSVSDAPEDFIASKLKGIVGIELVATKVEGKWKLSQNRTEEDANGVVDGLRQMGDSHNVLAEAMIQANDNN